MNITHTLNADSIKQAVLKVDEKCVYDIYYYCNSTGGRHAVGMLEAFVRPRIAINSIVMQMNNPDWANIVTLSACGCRYSEQRLVSITTMEQLEKIQENPLVGFERDHVRSAGIDDVSGTIDNQRCGNVDSWSQQRDFGAQNGKFNCGCRGSHLVRF